MRLDDAEVCNAVIKSAHLEDDRGQLLFRLELDYGGRLQAFGSYSVYVCKSYENHSKMTEAGHFIWRCMEIAGVSDWSRLPGQAIRVKRLNGLVHAIGHIVKDDWFCPKEDFAEERAAKDQDANKLPYMP